MARETLDLFIKVTDSNGAATFQRLGAAGKKATDEIAKGSKTGTTALKDMGREADNTARSAQKMESAFTKVGAGLGTVVTGLAAAGNASREQARQVDGIRRAYGDAADGMLAFASAVQESSNFSDDAARQSLISIQGLANQYGITQAQIEGLITRSADLAQINGLELQDAVQRTSAALRGEGESAEALGLNLSDAAVAAAAAAAGLTGWNTTMTEGEKAAFRYTILMEQSAFATGAAADAADSASGRTREFIDDIQNATASLGDFAGPAAEAASVLGSFALAAPFAGAAIGKMAAGAATAAGAAGLGGLVTAIGAIALPAIAATAAVGGLIVVLNELDNQDEQQTASEVDAIAARLDRLGLAADENAKKVFDWVRLSNQTGGMAAGQVQALNDSFDELLQLGDPYLSILLSVASGMDQGTESAMVMGQMIEDLYQTQLIGQTALYGQGLALQYAASEQQAYTQSVEEAIAAEERAAVKRAGRDTSLDPLSRPRAIGLEDPNADDMGLPDYNAEVARSTLLQEQMAEVQGRVADGFGEIKAETAAAAAEFAAATDAAAGFIGQADNILPTLLAAGKGLTGEQGLIRGVLDLTNAQAALDSTFDIIIGGTNAIGQSGQQVADWAQGLLDAGGAGADINALNSILLDNAAIQEDVTAIQAAQAGYIADATDNYAQYVDQLANGTEEQQRYALALADSNSQQQLADLYAAATSASLGQLGENGTDYVNQMAASLAVTNPLLYQMLVDTGAIKETADGIVFDFDATDAQSMVGVLGDMNATLGDLVVVLAEMAGIDISGNLDKGADAASRLADNIERAKGAASDGGGIGGFLGGLAGAFVEGGGGEPAQVGNDGGKVRNTPAIPDAASGLPSGITIPVLLDLAGFNQGVSEAERMVTDLAGGEYQVNITANGEAASATITNAEGEVVALVQGDYIIPINADGTPAYNERTLVKGAIEDLVGGNYVATINGDGSLAHAEIDLVNRTLNALNGTTGVIYINGDGSGARGTINSLTGFQGYATVVVNAVRGTSAGFTNIGLATGGTMHPGMGEYAPMMPSYANGGTHAMVGEHGPEMVWLPNGAQVTNAAATETRTRGGGRDLAGVGIYGPVTIVVQDQDTASAIRSFAYQGGGA